MEENGKLNFFTKIIIKLMIINKNLQYYPAIKELVEPRD